MIFFAFFIRKARFTVVNTYELNAKKKTCFALFISGLVCLLSTLTVCKKIAQLKKMMFLLHKLWREFKDLNNIFLLSTLINCKSMTTAAELARYK